MSDNTNRVEIHGCIVCGRLHEVLAVYTPAKKLVGLAPTTPRCHVIASVEEALVACDYHTDDEIKRALARHHIGPERPEDLPHD